MGAAGFAPTAKRSDTGLKLELEGSVYAKAWDVEEAFASTSGALTGYWQLDSRFTLAGRLGGQKLWGDYPWFEAAFIGGSDTVRGYGRNRYAGDASAFANLQAMVGLFNMNLVLPVRVGVLGLAEVGRVWLDGESSDKWHPAYGGGIFLRVLTTPAVFHGLVAVGDDGAHFHVNVGFGI
jgi:hemolysin activation/secretion protein